MSHNFAVPEHGARAYQPEQLDIKNIEHHLSIGRILSPPPLCVRMGEAIVLFVYIVQRAECYIQYDPGNIVVTVCIRRACAGPGGGTLVTLAAVSGPPA